MKATVKLMGYTGMVKVIEETGNGFEIEILEGNMKGKRTFISKNSEHETIDIIKETKNYRYLVQRTTAPDIGENWKTNTVKKCETLEEAKKIKSSLEYGNRSNIYSYRILDRIERVLQMIEIKKAFRSHSELLKLVKAYELLFDVKPKLKFKGSVIPFGYSAYKAEHPEQIEDEIERYTTKYIYLKHQLGHSFLVDETNHNFITMS